MVRVGNVGGPRLLGEATTGQNLAFVAGGPAFNTFGAGDDRSRLRFGATLDAALGRGISAFFRYDGLYSRSDSDQRLSGGVTVQF